MGLNLKLRNVVDTITGANDLVDAGNTIGDALPAGAKKIILGALPALLGGHAALIGLGLSAIVSFLVQWQESKGAKADEADVNHALTEFKSVRDILNDHPDWSAIPPAWQRNPYLLLLAVHDNESLRLDSLEDKQDQILLQVAAAIARMGRFEDETAAKLGTILDLQSATTRYLGILQSLASPPIRPAPAFPRPNTKDSDRFDYRNSLAPLIGRQQELTQLESWLQANRDFDWWLWYGPAGQGKSRLAQELCRSAVGNGWAAGFFRWGRTYDQWEAWKPDAPTLVVFDSVRSHATLVGGAIAALQAAKAYPVRFLLLERTFDVDENETWVRDLKSSAEEGWQRADDLPPRELGPLDEDDFVRLAYEVQRVHAKVFATRLIGEDEFKQSFTGSLNRLTEGGTDERRIGMRPLFAHFMGEAAATEGFDNLSKWDVNTLSGGWLRQEFDYWREEGVTEQEVNLLALATILGSVTDEARRQIAAEEPETNLPQGSSVPHARLLMPSPNRKTPDAYCGFEPDLIGEALVLERMKEHASLQLDTNEGVSPRPATIKLLKCAWKADAEDSEPPAAVSFSLRCAQDFPHHPSIETVLASVPAEGWPADSLRTNVVAPLVKADRMNLADACIGAIHDPGLRAMALVNKGVMLGRNKRSEEAISSYEAVISMPDAPADQRARALIGKGLELGQSGHSEAAIECYGAVESFTQASPKLRGDALFNKAVRYRMVGRWKDEIACYDSILAVFMPPSQWAKALYNKGLRLAALNDPQGAIECLGQAAAMDGVSPEQEAKALYHLGLTFAQYGFSEQAIACYNAVEALPNAPADLRANALESRKLAQTSMPATLPDTVST